MSNAGFVYSPEDFGKQHKFIFTRSCKREHANSSSVWGRSARNRTRRNDHTRHQIYYYTPESVSFSWSVFIHLTPQQFSNAKHLQKWHVLRLYPFIMTLTVVSSCTHLLYNSFKQPSLHHPFPLGRSAEVKSQLFVLMRNCKALHPERKTSF